MWSRIISRLLTSIVVAWASVTAAFLALHALPGRIQDILAGDLEYPGLREAIAAEWGLDRSLLEQYLDFLARIASGDRKSTRLNSSHVAISYAVFCLKKKK